MEINDDPPLLLTGQDWKNVVPPPAQLGLVAHPRSLSVLDVYAPVRSTVDRGATKDASHDDPYR